MLKLRYFSSILCPSTDIASPGTQSHPAHSLSGQSDTRLAVRSSVRPSVRPSVYYYYYYYYYYHHY